jgi:hypothetical protein
MHFITCKISSFASSFCSSVSFLNAGTRERRKLLSSSFPSDVFFCKNIQYGFLIGWYEVVGGKKLILCRVGHLHRHCHLIHFQVGLSYLLSLQKQQLIKTDVLPTFSRSLARLSFALFIEFSFKAHS